MWVARFGLALRTILPDFGESNSVPPLIDGEFSAAAKIRQEETVLFVINVEDAGAATRWAAVEKGDAGAVVGFAVDGAVAHVSGGCFSGCCWNCVNEEDGDSSSDQVGG